MDEREKIRQLLEHYIYVGLIEKDMGQLLECYSECILGIGIGEQGFVTSLQDVMDIYQSGLKTDDTSTHTLEFGRVEILMLKESFAIICAEVRVNLHQQDQEGKMIQSRFQQSLTVTKEKDEWKICGFHASTPTITEEELEAYPLKIAEKTLRNLREKIGEEAYQAEEQYRKAILADAVAFYIINFTNDCFEKCHLQGDLCVRVEPGTPYEPFVRERSVEYVLDQDQAMFVERLSLACINAAFEDVTNEVSCEYRMKTPDGDYIWTKTILRLITDVKTGDRKGIMYVKNIDDDMKAIQQIQKKADCDSMTKILNKAAFTREVERLMQPPEYSIGGVFLMMDVDNFKTVNDTYGHPVGDQALILVAEQIRQAFAPPIQTGRIGGDEFGVFLPGASLDGETKNHVDGFIDSVRRIQLEDIPQLKLTVSIGVAYLETGCFEDIYRLADMALYQAKRNGKDCISYC